MKELAKHNLAKAHYAAEEFKKNGAKLLFEGAPRFNEFVVQTNGRSVRHQRQASATEDHRRIPAEEVLSRTGQCFAVVLHRDNHARARSTPWPRRWRNGIRTTRSRKPPRTSVRTKASSSRSPRPARRLTSCRRSMCPRSTPRSCWASTRARTSATCPRSARSRSSATSRASRLGTTPSITACIRWAPAP